jgi:hypothetical protein
VKSVRYTSMLGELDMKEEELDKRQPVTRHATRFLIFCCFKLLSMYALFNDLDKKEDLVG